MSDDALIREPGEVRQVIPRDAIPSVDDPTFVAVADGELDPDEEVIALEIDGEARAYPVRYLHYHEIVNDEIAGRPVAVTWCPLCGSAVVYDRVVDGRTLEFGVSGKLADDDLVMYDRETGSEWKQSAGVAIGGKLRGTRLDVLAASLYTLSCFRDHHPEGAVMAPPGGASEAASDDDRPASIDYDAGPYEAYFDTEGFGLEAHRGDGSGSRTWDLDWLDPKAVVCGLSFDDANGDRESVGVPEPVVADAGGLVTLAVGAVDVVVFATDDRGVHAFRDPGYDWEPRSGGFRGGDALWNGATGETVDQPAAHTGAASVGDALERLPARRLFAFAWVDDHGADSLVRA
ncbi:DUF3179 domain-containing protein [Halobaculum halobium]|uniref:DUF3179 domain-containing protein n=1 Tax=Halobaculum halobium TaxID=3032281 RepID=A0ABD5TIZ9_9EURY|nr:DUF3179 domain-containing protein [Halobaculum sp. SYNS20]